MRGLHCALALAALSIAVSARADEVVFKNGDKISGKIAVLDGGKLTIESKVAGTIKVDMADVATFTSDGPIDIHLKDGSVINQKVAGAEAGTVAIAPGGAIKPQAVAIADMTKINPPPAKWTGSVTAGGLITRGNSNTEAFNLSLNLVRRTDDDRITVNGAYLYGRQKDTSTGDKTTTTDNWLAEGKYDYFFTKKFYGFVDVQVSRDRIAELNLRFAPSAGVGYQWAESDTFNFNTEAGFAWFYEDFSNDGTNENAALRLAYHVDYKFNDKVSAFHNLAYYPSLNEFSDFLLTADLGIRASISKQMFTEFKFEFAHDASPAPGARENDLRYILGAGWNF